MLKLGDKRTVADEVEFEKAPSLLEVDGKKYEKDPCWTG